MSGSFANAALARQLGIDGLGQVGRLAVEVLRGRGDDVRIVPTETDSYLEPSRLSASSLSLKISHASLEKW